MASNGQVAAQGASQKCNEGYFELRLESGKVRPVRRLSWRSKEPSTLEIWGKALLFRPDQVGSTFKMLFAAFSKAKTAFVGCRSCRESGSLARIYE